MPGKRKPILGRRFGRLVVTNEAFVPGEKNRKVTVLCDCGETRDVFAMNLKNGTTKSCGCLMSETSRETAKRHYGKAWERAKSDINRSPERLRSALLSHMLKEDGDPW
jgi:hypothetical protein